MPPWRWPSTSSGLRMRPASSTGDHAPQVDTTGLGVDLDHRDVGAERERGRAGREVRLPAQTRPRLVVLHGGRRHLGPRAADRRRAGDVERAVGDVEHDVVGAGLEQVGGDAAWLPRPRSRRPGRRRNRRPAATATPWSLRPRATRSVSPDTTWTRSIGMPVRLLHDHGERGGVTLAVRRRARVHGCAAVRMDLDRWRTPCPASAPR